MIDKISRNTNRLKRHARIRKSLRGTKDRPRLSVFRSLKHIYAQLIDDEEGKTLVSASSIEKAVKEGREGSLKVVAKKVGSLLAERIKEKGIEGIVFDRGGYKYHGKIAALAEGLREGGIQF
ncbi:MAG: 50S ribosomal protein L18 [Candidatus Eremiobacteraeota bacterium]|nr:50S ribosomal protein L18 [Candidatus Eremiobacteraeota bacterium]